MIRGAPPVRREAVGAGKAAFPKGMARVVLNRPSGSSLVSTRSNALRYAHVGARPAQHRRADTGARARHLPRGGPADRRLAHRRRRLGDPAAGQRVRHAQGEQSGGPAHEGGHPRRQHDRPRLARGGDHHRRRARQQHRGAQRRRALPRRLHGPVHDDARDAPLRDQGAGAPVTWFKNLSTRKKVALVLGALFLIAIIIGVATGSAGKNDEYQPQNEFKLDPWVSIKIGGLDLSINKAVLYLFLAATFTCIAMVYIAKRMQQKPNNVQTAVEAAYDLTNNNITRGNMDPQMAAKWFPFVATLFFFIWFSNLIGYLPLPTNSEETFSVFGLQIPSFALYAATANISIPLALTLVVWFSYHVEGIRTHGLRGYFATFIPAGTPKGMRVPIFIIELISHFVRIISLSVRLFANLLAGHLLILFMAGGLVVLLGLAALGVVTTAVVAVPFYLFEVVLIATLQAFIFATLTSIYLGGATAAEGH